VVPSLPVVSPWPREDRSGVSCEPGAEVGVLINVPLVDVEGLPEVVPDVVSEVVLLPVSEVLVSLSAGRVWDELWVGLDVGVVGGVVGGVVPVGESVGDGVGEVVGDGSPVWDPDAVSVPAAVPVSVGGTVGVANGGIVTTSERNGVPAPRSVGADGDGCRGGSEEDVAPSGAEVKRPPSTEVVALGVVRGCAWVVGADSLEPTTDGADGGRCWSTTVETAPTVRQTATRPASISAGWGTPRRA
jgi:hypothetical protein